MPSKVDFILNEALSLTSSERALLAHCLITSIDDQPEQAVEQEWVKLAQKRLSELASGSVLPVSWNELKQKVREP